MTFLQQLRTVEKDRKIYLKPALVTQFTLQDKVNSTVMAQDESWPIPLLSAIEIGDNQRLSYLTAQITQLCLALYYQIWRQMRLLIDCEQRVLCYVRLLAKWLAIGSFEKKWLSINTWHYLSKTTRGVTQFQALLQATFPALQVLGIERLAARCEVSHSRRLTGELPRLRLSDNCVLGRKVLQARKKICLTLQMQVLSIACGWQLVSQVIRPLCLLYFQGTAQIRLTLYFPQHGKLQQLGALDQLLNGVVLGGWVLRPLQLEWLCSTY